MEQMNNGHKTTFAAGQLCREERQHEVITEYLRRAHRTFQLRRYKKSIMIQSQSPFSQQNISPLSLYSSQILLMMKMSQFIDSETIDFI